MEPTRTQLMQTVQATLRDRVLPGVEDTGTARLVALCAEALDELLSRERNGAIGGAAVAELQALLDRGAQWGSAAPDTHADRLPSDRGDRQTLALDADMARLGGLMSALLVRKADGGAADAMIADLVRWESLRHHRPPAGAGEDAVPAPVPPSWALEPWSHYLTTRLGEPVAFLGAAELSGGFTNSIYRMAISRGGSEETLVVRLGSEQGLQWPYAASLAEEAPFLQLAARFDVPIAKLLWHESDRALLGSGFSVLEFVEGKVLGSVLRADRPIADALIAAMARAVASIHAIPWREHAAVLPRRLVPDGQLGGRDAVRLVIDRLIAYRDASWMSPSPSMMAMLDHLERHIGEVSEEAVIAHGDLGFHNWLFDGDRPTALLDWETVAICPPAKDLANLRDVVVPAAQWPAFLEAYVAAGGRRPCETELRYFKVMRLLHATICNATAMERMFMTEAAPPIDYLELGYRGRSYFFSGIVDALPDILS